MRQRGFALFDALLAVVLMAIAAAGSYTLVKSFRANSSTQQFIRYSTNITQSFLPFLDGNNSTVLSGEQLSTDFLNSIGIPAEDQKCSGDYCYVNAEMYLDNATQSSVMGFGVKQTGSTSQPLANYFIIAVKAAGTQVNQVLQSASSMFSIYCPEGPSVTLSGQSKCALQSSDDIEANAAGYSLFLVFPKSGDTAPSSTNVKPPS